MKFKVNKENLLTVGAWPAGGSISILILATQASDGNTNIICDFTD